MSDLPKLPQEFVIAEIAGLFYVRETHELIIHTIQSEPLDVRVIVEVVVKPTALREIVLALKNLAEQNGTSIEDLAPPHSFQ